MVLSRKKLNALFLLKNLKEKYIFNFLSGEISRIIRASDLTVIDLSTNNLTGRIPDEIVNNFNLFTGKLPRKVSDYLSRLDISNNWFFGNIPIEVKLWRNLSFFNDTIPRELTALPYLSTLLLDQNQLHGFLPSDIISWRLLNTLNLSKNKLSGQIQGGIGFLPSLNQLNLSENQFSGQIPPQLGRLRFTSLNLSSNNFLGDIP
ncbi:hypothetical protein REPUB_Repub03eG0074800 [Reevesia pubescens]